MTAFSQNTVLRYIISIDHNFTTVNDIAKADGKLGQDMLCHSACSFSVIHIFVSRTFIILKYFIHKMLQM